MTASMSLNVASCRARGAGIGRRARWRGMRCGVPLLAAIFGVGVIGGLGWITLGGLADAEGYLIVQGRLSDSRLHPVRHAGGRIAQVHAAVGKMVAEGELLATVDPGDVDARIEALKIEAQASQMRLEVVRREAQAFEVLQKQNLVARERVEALERKVAELERESAGVLARVAEADGHLALVEIRSPVSGLVHSIDGLVAGRDVRPGEILAEIAGNPGGLILDTALTAKQAAGVSLGRDVRIWPELAAWRDGRGFSGRLVSLTVAASAASTISGTQLTHIARVEVDARQATDLRAAIAANGGTAGISIQTGTQPAIQQFLDPLKGLALGNSSYRNFKGV